VEEAVSWFGVVPRPDRSRNRLTKWAGCLHGFTKAHVVAIIADRNRKRAGVSGGFGSDIWHANRLLVVGAHWLE
jgi:hypothetical protein